MDDWKEKFPPLFTCDIETIGIERNHIQRTFHPVRTHLLEGYDRDEIIRTVAIAYRHPDTGKLRSGVFVWPDPKHRATLREWFRLARLHNATLLGQNTLFDMLYLRYCDADIRASTDYQPSGPCLQLDDTQIVNFLDFEQRPEKSLKALTTLFGLGGYQEDVLTAKTGIADGPWDPKLHYYNAKDAIRTLQLHELLLSRIRDSWPSSPKLSPLCQTFRNDLLRVGLSMAESGIHIDLSRLRKLRRDYEQRLAELEAEGRQKYNLVMSGTGSEKSKRDFLLQLLGDYNSIYTHPNLLLTTVKKQVSISLDNLAFILSALPDNSSYRPALELMVTHLKVAKMLSSYLRPLLEDDTKKCDQNGMLFPSWHLVPSYAGKSDDSSSRGTIQGRMTCTNPGVQTWPPLLKKCMKSRHPGGVLVFADYNQLEIATAAFLSQDPRMLKEWNERVDRHTLTGLSIARLVGQDPDPSTPEFRSTWRQMGKTLNFLVLYGGGAAKYLETLTEHANATGDYQLVNLIHQTLNVPVCERILRQYHMDYARFRTWQGELVEEASRLGKLELPTGWSRSFPGGPSVIMSYVNEICNFPVQCLAAQLCQSAQMAVLRELTERRLGIAMFLQTYDSIGFDCPAGREDILREILERRLTRPPLFDIFKGVTVLGKEMQEVVLYYSIERQ